MVFADVRTAFSTPVLLQKILQSMENVDAPKRAVLVYTTISLILRLIGAQTGVFNTWYSRRAYERSRGELITMLYEKTLSRKIISAADKSDAQQNGEIVTNGKHHTKEPESSWSTKIWMLLTKFDWFKKSSSTDKSGESSKKKEPASMGKIINMMR